MDKNIFMNSCLRKEITNIDRYTKVSEREAKCIIRSVQKMYKDNGISCDIKKNIYCKKFPNISVTINNIGISFKFGISCKTTKFNMLAPKGELK